MKALSIRQPWAWAILHAGKRIENRSRADGRRPAVCLYTGPLLVHAAKGCSIEEWCGARNRMVGCGLVGSDAIPRLSGLDRGGIVGVCEVVGYVGASGTVYRGNGTRGPLPELDMRWHVPGSYGLVLANVRALPFVPFKGALGFFEVPDELVPGARP